MKFAVSVISPPNYVHSQAFREVAESIHYALLELGHDSVLTAQTNLPGRRHIILGSNLLPHYPVELAPGSILYNLEQITPNSPWLNPALLGVFARYSVWDYSQTNVAQLQQLGVAGVEHLPIGYVPQLTRIPRVDEDIDVLFIGSLNERRRAVVEALRSRGVKAEAAFGVYGADRDRLIARSKIVLNVHFYGAKVFEIVRVSYLLANGRFVVSERGCDREEEEYFSPGPVFTEYDELVDACVAYLARPGERAQRAAASFELMRGRPQAAYLEPLIAKLERAVRGSVMVLAPGPAEPGAQAPWDEGTARRADGGAAHAADGGAAGSGEVEPRVSVIIPVHNKVELTVPCLASLAETTADCSVGIEVIVVDNGSTDGTAATLQAVFGGDLTVLRNEENRGFGEACNQGAARARGELLLFLNNDTVLLPGWLPPLVAALDEDPRRAAVQPRLIYPDGRLNDAGGLMFRDGAAWVYGKGARVLDAPPFATRRAPDYATGACLLVRRCAFDAVGGFDPRYAPAYYEDADLSFALRAAGWTLLYEPASTIIHVEGGTAGTDVTVGLKQYQVRNRAVFAHKWEADLSGRPRLDPAIVDAWAHRGQGGMAPGEDPAIKGSEAASRTVLSIDPHPPLWDRAAGGMRTLQLLRSLRRDGHAVVHVAAAIGSGRQRYSARLAEFGVPLYGLDYSDLTGDEATDALVRAAYLPDLATLLQRHRPDVVLLSPWSLAEGFIGGIRELCPQALIVVDTCDVHFVRERRAAELAGDAVLMRQAEATRVRELAVYGAADRVVCVSEEDAAAVREALPGCDIVIAALAHDEVDTGAGFAERSGLLFVGNANHLPNLDAVHWWRSDIAPRLAERLPGVRLTVVGNDPQGHMRALADGHVEVLGWVPDTLPYLHAARVSVAPLRFGAGVKGKVGEALMAGLPVVGTPVAMEGLGLVDGQHALVAGDAEAFVDQVVRLYSDPLLWGRLREQGLSHARETLGLAAYRRAAAAIVAPSCAQRHAGTPLVSPRASVVSSSATAAASIAASPSDASGAGPSGNPDNAHDQLAALLRRGSGQAQRHRRHSHSPQRPQAPRPARSGRR